MLDAEGSVGLGELEVIAFNSHYGGNVNFKSFPWELPHRQCCLTWYLVLLKACLCHLASTTWGFFMVLLHFLIAQSVTALAGNSRWVTDWFR